MKDKLSKIGDKKGKAPALNVGDEGFNRSALSLRSEPGIVVEGEFRGGDIKVGGGKDDPRPGDSKSFSRSVVEIGRDQGGGDDDANEGETSQRHLYPHPHVQTEGESSRKRRDVDGKRTDQADTSPRSDIGNKSLVPSTSRVGKSEST